jgi:sporulation protein YlmC with PRC-barrel domain
MERMTVPIGAAARCTDGACGTVSRVVVDPVARALTHLVVEPHHRNMPGRLVPIDLVDTTGGEVRLRCSTAEFQALDPAEDEFVTSDAVLLGEVEVRRDDYVHATDGTIGRVEGLVIDADSHHVTHVLLQEGHLWGHKDVAIPISAVTGTTGGIQLSLSKQEVADLPPVDIYRFTDSGA